MPNHVDCDFWILGNVNKIKKFLAIAKEGDCILSANKFIPYPKEFKDLDDKRRLAEKEATANLATAQQNHASTHIVDYLKSKLSEVYCMDDGFNSGGYEWCRDNWGTKWGIYDTVIEDSNLEDVEEEFGKVFISFNSAWSPPLPIIKKMAEAFPDLTFSLLYYERGAQYCGVLTIKKGQILDDFQANYYGDRGG